MTLQSDILFSEKTHLTRDQLVKYHLDQMSKEEKYAVEKHLVDCDLCKDALAGIAVVPSYKSIEKIRRDVRRLVRPGTDAMRKIAWRNTIIAAAVLSILILAVLLYLYLATKR